MFLSAPQSETPATWTSVEVASTFYSAHISNEVDSEVLGAWQSVILPPRFHETTGLTKELLPHLPLILLSVPDGSLREPVLGNLIGNVGSRQGRTGNAKSLLNDIGENVNISSLDVDTLLVSTRIDLER
jgi:hypothetical protein